MNIFKYNFIINLDAPSAWGIYFQDSATPQMEGLVELHDNIMYYLVIILFAVGWVLLSIVRNYVATKSPISHKYLNHGIKVCLFTCLLILNTYFQGLYLSFLSLVINIYIVLMLLKRWFNKINFSTQNFFLFNPSGRGVKKI